MDGDLKIMRKCKKKGKKEKGKEGPDV